MSMQGCTPLNNVRYIMRSANPRFPKACLTLPNDPKLHTQAAVLVSDCSKISKPDSWLFTKSGVGTKPSWTTQYLQKGFFLIGTKSMGIAGVDWPDSDAATRFKLWHVNPVDVFKTFGCNIIGADSTSGEVVSGKNSLTLSSDGSNVTLEVYQALPTQEWVLEIWDDVLNLNY